MKAKNPQKRKQDLRVRRRARIRAKITLSRPRLAVFRSAKHIYAQVIDDATRKTLASASDKDTKGARGIAGAETVGRAIAERAIVKGIKKVVFDRAGYAYHGQVKALAEGAREGGLEF